MNLKIKIAAIFSFIFLISVVIAGCTINSGKTGSATPSTISQHLPPADFIVTISKDGLRPITNSINRNLSDIQSRNFTEIPVLLDLVNTSYCGYNTTSNYSAVADVALHDPRIQRILTNGGIVEGIYFWGPPSYTKEESENACSYCSVTFEMQYQGKNAMALINESMRTVILPPEFS